MLIKFPSFYSFLIVIFVKENFYHNILIFIRIKNKNILNRISLTSSDNSLIILQFSLFFSIDKPIQEFSPII